MRKAISLQHQVKRHACAGAWVLCASLAGWQLPAQPAEPAAAGEKKDGDKPEAKEKEEEGKEYLNWVNAAVGGTFVSGDEAAFQSRYGLPSGAFGGIGDFHWEKEVAKKALFKIDGRGIFDAHDYLLRLDLAKEDLGFVRAGYREFRTWYDGSGGFVPATQTWVSLYDDVLALDRRSVWLEAGLRKPKLPELTLRYSHDEREGQKDSLAWGDVTAVPLSLTGERKIAPAFWNIDERRDTFQLEGSHKIGKTALGLGLRYDLTDYQNSRNMRRYPGEGLGVDRHVTQNEATQGDMFNVHVSSETRFNPKLQLGVAYSFTTLDTDVGGDRILGDSYGADYNPGFANAPGFLGLSGGSQMQQHLVALNLLTTPVKDLQIVPSVRAEKKDLDSATTYLSTPSAVTSSIQSEQDLINVAGRLEARYSGITNWVFYGRGDWTSGDGNLTERQIDPNIARDTDYTRFIQQYTVGANWYPVRKVSLGAQYFYRLRNNDYDHQSDSTPNLPSSFDRYPAYLVGQDYQMHDANLRLTVRPLNNLTLVGRYDYQTSTFDTQADGLGSGQAAETDNHVFSLSASWVPWSRLYCQVNGSYVLSETETPAQGAIPGVPLVLASKNDYLNLGCSVGFVLDEKTDLEVQYLYYRADNFDDNSAFSQPYGAGAEEHAVSVGAVRRLKKNLTVSLKYGYFTSHDETSGGNNDYDTHLVYSSLRYQF